MRRAATVLMPSHRHGDIGAAIHQLQPPELNMRLCNVYGIVVHSIVYTYTVFNTILNTHQRINSIALCAANLPYDYAYVSILSK